MGGEGGWRPPFASGKIAGSYEPLKIYMELARERGREDLLDASILREEDFRMLRERVEREGRVRLLDLLNELEEYFAERVDPELAREAYRRYGLDLATGDARKRLARLMAAWLLEAGEEWGYVRLA